MSLSEEQKNILQTMLNDENTYIRHDPLLGWSLKPNGSRGELYRANSDGIRAAQEYKLTPSTKLLRIASFGDSFTHGDDVSNQNTWQELLSETRTNLEVLNFGVSGFGLDQSYLRYQRDGVRYQPHMVLIGFMSENIRRHLNVFRPFYYSKTGLPMSKPRFVLRNGQIILQSNLLKQASDYELLIQKPEITLTNLGKHDWYFHQKPKKGPVDFLPSVRVMRIAAYEIRKRMSPVLSDGTNTYNEHSEAFQLTLRIFDEFHDSVVNQGALPIVVLFPNRRDLSRYRETGRSVFAPMVEYFREAEYRYIDLHDAFEMYASEVPLDDLFGGRHYSPAGNRVVAVYLANYLTNNDAVRQRRKQELAPPSGGRPGHVGRPPVRPALVWSRNQPVE